MYLRDEGGAEKEDEISVIATQKETLSVIVLLHLHVLSLKCACCQITLLV